MPPYHTCFLFYYLLCYTHTACKFFYHHTYTFSTWDRMLPVLPATVSSPATPFSTTMPLLGLLLFPNHRTICAYRSPGIILFLLGTSPILCHMLHLLPPDLPTPPTYQAYLPITTPPGQDHLPVLHTHLPVFPTCTFLPLPCYLPSVPTYHTIWRMPAPTTTTYHGMVTVLPIPTPPAVPATGISPGCLYTPALCLLYFDVSQVPVLHTAHRRRELGRGRGWKGEETENRKETGETLPHLQKHTSPHLKNFPLLALPPSLPFPLS